ncbi:MAG: 4-hydroxy-3-methylbut-2-enyl diphosphate reductase [Abditibacteriota bacterium]|nr:4-hydroxy-3-methylbut-2-enyl diphosphate reductase [Abditibacteriota bacterium]
MKIKISEHSGFCFGVKRAMDIVLSNAKDKDKKIATLGPLIHNPQVVEDLKEKGVEVTSEIDKFYDKIIMPSHGVPKEFFKKCENLGIEAIDATCPFVEAVHEKVVEYKKAGLKIVIVGDAGHSEVKGIMSSADNDCIVISSIEDVDKYDFKKKKLGIVSQTTNSPKYFGEVVGKIAQIADEITVANTICYATHKRQAAAHDLAPNVDVMLVVGGKNSANTNRLFQICKEMNPHTYHIETDEEISGEMFENCDTVGITAGASTPDYIIEDICKKIDKISLSPKP